MREHLYKAKRVDKGEVIVGSLIIEKNEIPYFTDRYLIYNGYNAIEQVIPETVCEYADKIINNRKIFEGDQSYEGGTVVWCKKRLKWVVRYDDREKDLCKIEKFEFKGNIHDEMKVEVK